ncbi:MAG: hypothetical protein IT373_02635 [Polyangiaceae bacterium]|nr:hypothetical protein [Polyangiaceae bacterium]
MASHQRTSTLAVAALFALGGSACDGDQTATQTTRTSGEDLAACGDVGASPEVLAAPSAGAPAAVDDDLLIAGSQIFWRSSLGWTPEAEIELPEGTCCRAAALSGDTAIVVARLEGAWSGGPAFVLERERGAWTAIPVSPGYISRSVAISGDLAAVGCHGGGAALGCAPPFGTVGIYERMGGAWTQTGLVQSDTEQCLFGESIALSGDTLLVGEAPRAHAYVRDGASWVRQGVLEAPGSDGHVALSGNVAVVGRRPMYVFQRVDGTWQHTAELRTALPEACTWVALRGGCLAAGAALDDAPGRVELFEWSLSGWGAAGVLTSGATEADGFGTTVSLTQGWLVVGGHDAAWAYPLGP